jgi:hypothetical protein
MNSDYLKITIYDQYHSKYFEDEVKIKDKKKMRALDESLRTKGLRIINLTDWF